MAIDKRQTEIIMLARFEEETTYEFGSHKFIVTPHFQQKSTESVGSILLKLMQEDVLNS